ncbi:MAG TPA: ABC transporter substrate-binding protein [Gemmataceae bacterium]|nr:ABC transporter substrate-binding protein [Gemmataceae bacterium]
MRLLSIFVRAAHGAQRSKRLPAYRLLRCAPCAARKYQRIVSACLGLLFLLTSLGCSSKATPEPVWIGQLLPLEGSNRTLAQHARQGVEQAVAESREAGYNIAGRPFAVLHADSRDDAAAVQAETVRLVTVNKAVALLADFDATLTERLIRSSRPYGVPVIVPGELPEPPESDAIVVLGVPPAVRGRMLARYASADLKCRRAAVLTDSRRPVAAALAAAFVKAWPRDHDGAVEEWTFTTAAERDERVARLIQAAPTIIVLACSVADFRMLRPRLGSALQKVPLIYGGEDAGTTALQADLETHSDVYLATAYSAEKLSDSGRAFAGRYKERFHEPPDFFAAQSYDATRLLFDALQRAGAPSRDALGKTLSHMEQFDSVTGPIRWKDRLPRRRVFLIALKNNKPSVVSVLEPDEN